MKLRQLIVGLQKIASTNPNADVRFSWINQTANQTSSLEGGDFVDAKIENNCVVIRIGNEFQIDEILKL